MYFHALVIGALSWLLVLQEDFIGYAILIALSHLVIDWIKVYLRPGLCTFLTDQLCHLIVLFTVSQLYDMPDKRVSNQQIY